MIRQSGLLRIQWTAIMLGRPRTREPSRKYKAKHLTFNSSETLIRRNLWQSNTMTKMEML